MGTKADTSAQHLQGRGRDEHGSEEVAFRRRGEPVIQASQEAALAEAGQIVVIKKLGLARQSPAVDGVQFEAALHERGLLARIAGKADALHAERLQTRGARLTILDASR